MTTNSNWIDPESEFKTHPHGGAPACIHELFPEMDTKKISDAFLYGTEMWPSGGVYKQEMNKVFKSLKIDESFKYKDCEDKNINLEKFLKKDDKTFIVLLETGFFVLIKKGVAIRSRSEEYKKEKEKLSIHAYWEFL